MVDSEDPGRGGASQPADRVKTAAIERLQDRFLEVYVANSPRSGDGVGVIVFRLTPADEDAFFAATCFHRGDVQFVEGPASLEQLHQWRAEVRSVFSEMKGGCGIYHDAREGKVHVGIETGQPGLRRELERKIPPANLAIEEGGCTVPL